MTHWEDSKPVSGGVRWLYAIKDTPAWEALSDRARHAAALCALRISIHSDWCIMDHEFIQSMTGRGDTTRCRNRRIDGGLRELEAAGLVVRDGQSRDKYVAKIPPQPLSVGPKRSIDLDQNGPALDQNGPRVGPKRSSIGPKRSTYIRKRVTESEYESDREARVCASGAADELIKIWEGRMRGSTSARRAVAIALEHIADRGSVQDPGQFLIDAGRRYVESTPDARYRRHLERWLDEAGYDATPVATESATRIDGNAVARLLGSTA